MKQIIVYHNQGSDFHTAKVSHIMDLDKVAIVEVSGFEHGRTDAFRLTNHIDRPWQRNPEVRAVSQNPRSTSVGDVMFTWGTGQDEACEGAEESWIVAPVGFVRAERLDGWLTRDNLPGGCLQRDVAAHAERCKALREKLNPEV